MTFGILGFVFGMSASAQVKALSEEIEKLKSSLAESNASSASDSFIE